jgi:hypothetical protein
MAMPKTIAAYFIAVDLDVRSSFDLSPLVQAWTDHVTATHIDRDGRRHWVHFMLFNQMADPARSIREYCRLVQRLPKPARTVWDKATSKEFDIGFQAGFESRAAEWVLDAKTMRSVNAVGAGIRITVYSPLQLLEQEDDAPGA